MVLSCVIFSGMTGVELILFLVMAGTAYGEKARLWGIAQRYAEWFWLLNGSVVENSKPKKRGARSTKENHYRTTNNRVPFGSNKV